jgi:hypothetical protein
VGVVRVWSGHSSTLEGDEGNAMTQVFEG